MSSIGQYAFRQLFSPRKRFLANSRVAGALLGIILSLIPVMVVMVVVDGMIDGISERFLSLGDSHIKVNSYTVKSAEEIEQALDVLNQFDRIQSHVVSVRGKGLIINPESKMKTGVDIKGFPSDLRERDQGFRDYMEILDGEFDLSTPRSVMVSSAAASELGIAAGDQIELLMVVTLAGRERPITGRYRVAGIFSTGYYQLDNVTVYMNYNRAYSLLREKGVQIYLKVDDPHHDIYELTRQIRSQMNLIGSWNVSSWQLTNRTFFVNLENTRFLIMLVMFGILFVTSFNILSTFFMIVKEKESEIAILKSCGVSGKVITRSFLLSGLMLAVAGTLIGMILGILVAANINGVIGGIENFVNFFRRLKDGGEFALLSSDYYLDTIPVRISWVKSLLIAGFSILLAFVFTLIPAVVAGRVKPIEIIRKH